jgi:hypothetical protein
MRQLFKQTSKGHTGATQRNRARSSSKKITPFHFVRTHHRQLNLVKQEGLTAKRKVFRRQNIAFNISPWCRQPLAASGRLLPVGPLPESGQNVTVATIQHFGE